MCTLAQSLAQENPAWPKKRLVRAMRRARVEIARSLVSISAVLLEVQAKVGMSDTILGVDGTAVAVGRGVLRK